MSFLYTVLCGQELRASLAYTSRKRWWATHNDPSFLPEYPLLFEFGLLLLQNLPLSFDFSNLRSLPSA